MRNGIHKIEKGYLKIHVAVDIKTKEILALEVTDEKVHDGRMLKKLVDHVLDSSSSKSNMAKVKFVLADGAYDSNNNFQYLENKRIKPGIKVRKNSIISCKNNSFRNKQVIPQSKDFLKWKKKRKYGRRWMAETAFSSIKRTFGEQVSATRFQNMVKEVMIKVSSVQVCLEEYNTPSGVSLELWNYATQQYSSVNSIVLI